MKYLRSVFFVLIILILPMVVFGQNANDVLRLSNIFYKGTARFMGMSGAFGALGSDFSTLSVNPAGIGVYKMNDFVFSPGVYHTRSQSNFFGNTNDERRTHFNFNNLGMIVPFSTNDPSLKYFQFGVGYNRIQDFHNRSYIDGFNTQSSFLTGVAELANGSQGVDVTKPLYIQDLAASTLLIFQQPENGNRWTCDNPDGNIRQKAFIETSGALDEMVISMGGNVKDKLFFGVTLGLPFYEYKSHLNFNEFDQLNVPDTTNPFKSMNFQETLTTKGAGVNGKFGIIYKPFNFLRLGFAVHTPTYYWELKDTWKYKMQSHFDYNIEDPYNSGHYVDHVSDETKPNYYIYEVTTPTRLIASAAFAFKNWMLIDVDCEWVNHSNNLITPASEFSDVNKAIRDSYTKQFIIRAGAEMKFKSLFLRGGYARYGSPYKKNINDAAVNSWSLGAGIRRQFFGIDFAYQHLSSKSDYYLYNMGGVAAKSAMKNSANNYVVTFTFRF